jgi:hypothetical protein
MAAAIDDDAARIRHCLLRADEFRTIAGATTSEPARNALLLLAEGHDILADPIELKPGDRRTLRDEYEAKATKCESLSARVRNLEAGTLLRKLAQHWQRCAIDQEYARLHPLKTDCAKAVLPAALSSLPGHHKSVGPPEPT